ncbi:MAG: arginine--tRNA ligase [Pelagibacteraceae bacterium]|nr:arginine--tRNA ligase [Pelagibacteraceae bacterium]
MNIFSIYLEKIKEFLIDLEKHEQLKLSDNLNNLTIELTPKNLQGDISCNAALILSKTNNKKPKDIAEFLKTNLIIKFSEFKNIFIAEPGFLNIEFKDDFWHKFLSDLLNLKEKYGSNSYKKNRYNVEFVSANPTGPLHVGHCRGSILGDVIANLLIFNGNAVTKEYYVNDLGKQIKNFTLSVYYRIIEILHNKEFPKNVDDLYPGENVVGIAKKIIDKKLISEFNNFDKIYEKLREISIKESLELIKINLNSLGIQHDHFVFESQLYKNNEIQDTVEKLKKKDLIYYGKIAAPKFKEEKNWKERKQLLFKSTLYGDDKDRPLQKNDSSWTYFAGDLAYHNNKIDRKFDILINVLGADHTGYIKRINAGVEALSNKKTKLSCKVSQLVKLIKDGKPFKMSKRKGDYITVEDLINEVGRDPVRFIMLSRSNDVELDFDFKKVTEKTKDNPVYYVQYCYARICSVFRNINKDLNEEINFDIKKFHINSYERQIIKKLSEWPKCISISTQRMEPHRIPVYLYELSSLFHSYWNLGKDDISFRFISDNKPTSLTKLIILKCISYVIKSGMNLIGVNTPNKM